jgi:hypothetical protein
MPIPQACQAIDRKLQQLKEQLRNLNSIEEPDGPVPKPRPDINKREKD